MGTSKKSSNIGRYISDIKKYKLINPDIEKKLCNEMLIGNLKSRNELITANLGLVIKLGIMYKDRGLSVDDLICEGNKGLIVASKKFDPSLDNRFSTYAYYWIKQSMLSAIEDNNKWNCLSPSNVSNYEESYNDKKLSVDMTEFDCENPKKIKEIIKMIDGLPKRDSSIVKHYFGISGFSEMNTIELSEKYAVTVMRISSIIDHSMREIRCKMLEKV
jgi:RNA polymerase sigma factor (sigma-70 family)